MVEFLGLRVLKYTHNLEGAAVLCRPVFIMFLPCRSGTKYKKENGGKCEKTLFEYRLIYSSNVLLPLMRNTPEQNQICGSV